MERQVGKYQLLRELGRGGMAEVFLALETGPSELERLVVLKRVLPDLADNEQFNTMFLDEARIAMRLNHPNIAHIYEVGEHDGRRFQVMEFVHGADLRSVLRRWETRTLTPAQSALIMARTAAALHHAHNQKTLRGEPLNIVHRDVSPANICISNEGIVKVLDFGIAKATTNLDKTMMGVLKGKYPYMSPEQARAEQLDGRSDLFSLGVVFFEALTYRRLFKRESEAESLEALLYDEIFPPSAYAEVPVAPELDRITLRLLERDVDKRYQSGQEVVDDLEAYLRVDPASTSDLAGVMTEIYGAKRDLSRLLEDALAGGEVMPYTPSQSLPTISTGEHGPTSVYQRDGACLHCGEAHGPDHKFCPETGKPIAGRQLASRSSGPIMIVDSSAEIVTSLVDKPVASGSGPVERLPEQAVPPAASAAEPGPAPEPTPKPESESEPDEPLPAPPPRRRTGLKIVFWVVIGTILCCGVGAGWWLFNHLSGGSAP